MIRINLIAVERPQARKAFAFGQAEQLTAACVLVLVASLAGIGWWYWSLEQESARLDTEIASARQDAAKLRSLLHEVEQFEARRTQLQQRVGLIEELRKGQSVPVQLLDHVSRSLPDMMWLTSVEENNSTLTLEGRSTTLIALSDFVANLGSTDLLKKPIEIVNSQAEAPAQAGTATPAVGSDVIKFTVKAQLAGAVSAAAPATTGAERAAAVRAAAAAAAQNPR
jgi:type IV pilus assembly protein PilN